MSNMVVNTNILSLNAHRNMKNVGLELSRASVRLTSGYRINSSADDAAGMAISETMRAQIRGLDQASRNSQDGSAMIRVAESGLQEVSNMIHRIRELAVQGANDTNVSVNRNQLALEVFQLTQEIRATEDRVQFNTMNILRIPNHSLPENDPAADESIIGNWFQLGPNSHQGIVVNVDVPALMGPYRNSDVTFLAAIESVMNHVGLALQGQHGNNYILGNSFNYSGDDSLNAGLLGVTNNDVTGKTQSEWISVMIGQSDFALNSVAKFRASLGAIESRLDSNMRSLDISSQSLSDAESRIRNADMAREMMRFTMANVLQQSSISVLAQANHLPNNLLALLR